MTGETLRIVVEARGHASDVPLRDLELVVHGQVVKTASAGETGQSAERLQLSHDLRVGAHGVWVAARARGGPTQAAHTTPVYVRANGVGFANPATARRYLELSESYLREIEAELAQAGDGGQRPALALPGGYRTAHRGNARHPGGS